MSKLAKFVHTFFQNLIGVRIVRSVSAETEIRWDEAEGRWVITDVRSNTEIARVFSREAALGVNRIYISSRPRALRPAQPAPKRLALPVVRRSQCPG